MRSDTYHSDCVDMWCCGCMLLMMVTGRVPPWQVLVAGDAYSVNAGVLSAATQGRQIRRLAVAEGPRTDACWALMQSLLLEDPLARPSAQDALRHEWFAGL